MMPKKVQETYEALVKDATKRLNQDSENSKIRIQIGSATCEHAAGAMDVLDEFQKHLDASGRSDVILHKTGCTGRCSCEPIVGVLVPGELPVKYQKVNREVVHKIFTSHIMQNTVVKEHILDSLDETEHKYEVMFCSGLRCNRDMGFDVRDKFKELLNAAGLQKNVAILPSNCFGLCKDADEQQHGHVLIRPSKTLYHFSSEKELTEIVDVHIKQGKIVEKLKIQGQPLSQRFFDLYGDVAFFNQQSRIALRNAGVVNPESIDEYIHYKGFEALSKVLGKDDPDWIIDELQKSKLRGRGGGGYPTALKWKAARQNEENTRYIICNADEGDPGAFMDRSMLESDPFSIIEGMIIGGFAIGAQKGFFYIRAEYPLAIKRITQAIEECHKYGILGGDVMGSGFSFDLEIRLGAGAFVCGEETALIHSIEGKRGQPRIRPPFPSTSGLWGKPTVINNVETFANIPAIIGYGGGWFGQIGTEKSGGTKVFALAGKVKHTGLVEVPMGTTLREVVFGIGGGIQDNKELKAIQTGGPAGGCLPSKWLDTIVDFDSLNQAGSIMGSGGMIVLDETDCMVDVAKFFLTFSQDESCGKCTPCREGTKRMLEILERITEGKGEDGDIEKLERLASLVKKTSLCGLGRAAPNPVLSTIRHFREEYETHIKDKKCPAKKCTSLVQYEIDAEKCVGCTLCAKNCPVDCISGERKQPHEIDQKKCIKCGRCFEVCKFAAVKRS